MHNHVNTREELEAYDPDLAGFIAEVFRHKQRLDGRYRPHAAPIPNSASPLPRSQPVASSGAKPKVGSTMGRK